MGGWPTNAGMSERPARVRRALSWALPLTFALFLVFSMALPGSAQAYTSSEQEFLRLINQYRQDNGLGTLLISDVVSDAAEKHNKDMGTYAFFDHTTRNSDYFPVNSSPWDRMAICGYGYNTSKGENIAAGYASAAAVFAGWKASPGHNTNMLNSNFRVIGISLDTVSGSPYGTYWTTDFGGFVDPSAHDLGGGTTTTTLVDASGPAVSFIAPAGGATVSGSVPISVNASDNVGVAKVELRVDGTLAATDTSAPYSLTWNTSTASNGSKTLSARAYDAAGNTADASITVTVANGTTVTTAPATTTTTVAATTTTTVRTTTTTTVRATTTTAPPTSTTTTAPTTTTTAPHSTTTTTTSPRTTTTTLPAGFIDVPAGYRFYHEVMSLAGAEIIGGFSDGSFRPDDPVKRAQFAKIIMLAVGRHTDPIEAAGQATFPDVPWAGVTYPFDYVEEAADLGIIKGLNGGLFGPYSNITRAQLALMLVRAGGTALTTPPPGYAHGFVDVPAFADEAVAIARYNGLLSGKTDKLFDPYGVATRGQVAKMTSNLVERLK